MSSQPNHSNPSHPPPLPHPAYHRPPQSGWQPNGGGSPFVHRSTPQHVDPYTRIAVLEKEVEHYKVEKATAELAVQYLANLSAKGERCGNGDEQLAKLTSELTRANEDNLVLKAKLENTQSIIITLLTCGKLESLNHSPKSDQKSQQPSISVETVDLIDLVDTVKSSDCGKGVQDDTTLLDTSHDDFSDLEDAVPSAVVVKQQDQPESIAFPDSQYIHHFTQRKCEILDTAGNVIGLEASLKVSPHLQRCAMESDPPGDQCSETSAEPNSSNSSQYYADSSATVSFVTANTDKLSEDEVSTAPAQPLDTQTSAVQQESTPIDAASTANSDPCAQPCHSKQVKAEGSKEHNFAFAKAALGPTLRKPSWKVNSVSSTDNSQERSEAVPKRGMGPAKYRYPELFKYGIRYMPDEEERNIYRTILISNLPADITIHQLLEKVRGGIVVDAKLMDTMKLLGGNSALIIFLHEHAALDYEQHAKCHPFFFHDSLANVRMVSTPTWPIDPGLRDAIDNHQHTRCLEVHNFPRRQITESRLRNDLQMSAQMNGNRIEHLKLRSDNVLEISLTSIDYAGIAFGMFTTFRCYRNCKTRFVADPCAQPLESLLTEEANEDNPSVSLANLVGKNSLEQSSDIQE